VVSWKLKHIIYHSYQKFGGEFWIALSNGRNYIAHVDIPEKVKNAFEELKGIYGDKTREANPLYSSM